MERYSSSDSNISLDSLETEFKKKSAIRKQASEENVETILVPFYEKDVLIKVPKGKTSRNRRDNNALKNSSDRIKKETTPKNYLVNKDGHKSKRTSYLEIFRKQFTVTQPVCTKNGSEIRSISPEFGDTERESFVEDSNPAIDFLNTEAYNEIYYHKLMNQELNNYIEQSVDEQLKLSAEIRSNSPDDLDFNNLKSVSASSQPRHHIRRATVQPIENVKLGGLGPDMENIKPRLERARSLQRYSEKVRMENRVKIYKKSLQEEIEKKADNDITIRRNDSAKTKERIDGENTYLVNKNIKDKNSQIVKRKCNSKSKSANVQRTKESSVAKVEKNLKTSNNGQTLMKSKQSKRTEESNEGVKYKERIKSCDKTRKKSDIKQASADISVPPVQISFLVNMGGIRPSSALRKLEATHRVYQEKVKAFTTNNDENNDAI